MRTSPTQKFVERHINDDAIEEKPEGISSMVDVFASLA